TRRSTMFMDGSLHFLRAQHRQPLAHAPAAGLCTGLPAPISSPAARARTELAAGAGKGAERIFMHRLRKTCDAISL
ncbi:hypothetical protein, partial [Acinetobacter baumannii]